MTRTYTAVNGDSMDINLSGNNFLARLTFASFPMIGFDPRTEEDCQIVARLIRNYIHLQQYWSPSWKSDLGIAFEEATPEMISWLKKVATFFENAGGIVEE